MTAIEFVVVLATLGRPISAVCPPIACDAGDPQTTLTHHTTGTDNAIQSVTVDPPDGAPATQAFVYDIAGNLVFDGNWLYQYDGLNRLVQVNTAGSRTAGDFNAAGAPVDPNTFAPGDLMARYAYDGLGRLIVRQVPLSRGIPDAWTPYVQAESYYYDGVRRIQTAIERDPNELVLVAAATLEPAFLLVAERDVLEYVWGPDYVDELVCQYGGAADPNAPSFGALTDANYNVMAIVDGDCEVVEQYVYDPYGGLLAVETLDPNTTVLNRVAHQGLFFERFADDILSPPLAVGAPGVYENRNRKYEPYLSRFLQKDVNAAAQPVLDAIALNGARLASSVDMFDAEAQYVDGTNLYVYGAGSPVTGHDPLGLSWDEDIDSFTREYGFSVFRNLATLAVAKGGIAYGSVQASLYAAASFLWDDLVWMINEDRLLDLATAGFGARACFAAGTEILMADGSVMAIDDIQIGDCVLAYSEGGSCAAPAEVVACFVRDAPELVWLAFENGPLLVTAEHPFHLSDVGWIAAGQLKEGDCVTTASESCECLLAVDTAPGGVVFSIEVRPGHTYYVGSDQLLVHNACLHLGKTGGHHIIPKWAGGKERQWLHRLDFTKARGAHRSLETAISHVRFAVARRHGLAGNMSAREWKRAFGRYPGLQKEVFDELDNIYRIWDSQFSTELSEGLRRNIQLRYYSN
ncbi:MAG: hypothetical protein H3C42_07615 [Phycisphaerae bacterium]|nr:hypothetical protein [Phycisphaerae bacterium]